MSDEHYVITISRQFGSMGRSIAKELSGIMGIYFMDRDIVEQTAKRLGMPLSTVADAEERSKHNPFWYRKFPLGIGPLAAEDEIFQVQSNIIRDTADKQDCIIVGRCAESVLRSHKRKLSVYIKAPFEQRLKNCTDLLGMDEKTAMRMIHDVDLARVRYRERYIEDAEDPFSDCSVILDSSVFGISETARIIALIANETLHCSVILN